MMDRSIKTNQDKLRFLMLTLTTTGTPAVSGIDAQAVSSVVDNGAGDVTIIFNRPAHTDQDVQLIGQATVGTAPLTATVEATDFDRITVNLFDKDGVKTDGVVNLLFALKDNKFNR
jgi:hypothetical protein